MDFRKAYVQYGDLYGESAIDGFSGSSLSEFAELVNMPNNYFPIGLAIYSDKTKYFDDKILLQVVAVEKKEYGYSIKEISESVLNGKINAKVFESQIKYYELFKYIKRIHITAIYRGLLNNIIETDELYLG